MIEYQPGIPSFSYTFHLPTMGRSPMKITRTDKKTSRVNPVASLI